jgi:hypothetical protein
MRRAIAVITLVSAFLTGQAFAGQWTSPVLVGGVVNTSYDDSAPFISSDGLSLYFVRNSQMYQATRSTPSGSFTSAKALTALGAGAIDPWVSTDNLRMYYYGAGWVLKMSQRSSVLNDWSAGTPISSLNAIGDVGSPTLTADELTMVFVDGNPTGDGRGADLYMATRSSRSSSFGNVTALTTVNSSVGDGEPYLTPDGLGLYFTSTRNGMGQIFESTRSTPSSQFGTPQLVPFINQPSYPYGGASLSSDGQTLYLNSNMLTGSGQDIYVSYLVPEPATISLLAFGAFMLRRKNR